MTTRDEIYWRTYWRIATAVMQINSLIDWMNAQLAGPGLHLKTILFLGYTIQKLQLYMTTVAGIVLEPDHYQVRPRLLF